MSSILKALKKLEEEKAARRDGTIHLASDILKGEIRPGSRRRWLLPALASGALIASVVALLSLRGGTASSPGQQLPPPASAPPVPRDAVPAGQFPGAAQPSAPPTEEPVTVIIPPQAAPRQPERRPNALRSLPVPLPATAPLQTPPAAKPAPPPEEKAPLPAVAEPAGPTLNVSGIAWQKDSANRLAIINGQPLATGTTIEGVLVEEILPDRVRFSHNRKSFEVFLGKTGNAN
jgi:general secretion pathway protein B